VNQEQRHALELRHAREDERRRIARELHQGVAQTLTALRIQFSVCESQLKEDTQAQQGLSELRPLIEQPLTELQDLIESFRPAIPEGVGLPAALQALISFTATSTGKDIRFQVDEPFPALLLPLESIVYQTIKDILPLIAEQTTPQAFLDIRLEVRSAQLQLQIRGCDRQTRESVSAASGILARIREQAETIGGKCVMLADADLTESAEAIVMTLPLLLRDAEETV
jgi:two-component system NarL family sensor kinase